MNTQAKKLKTEKRKHSKRIFAAIAAVIIIAGTSAGVYAFSVSSSSEESNISYREYSISKGDITVGITESGTVSLEREYVSFPCAAEVLEVYVKTGSSVKEGDPIVRLSIDDIDEVKAEYESKLKDAKLALQQAEQEYKTKTFQAEQTLASSLEKGETAQSEYELYLEKNERSKASEQENLSEFQSELEEYTALSLTYDDDYKIITDYESRLEEYEAEYKEMQKIYKEMEDHYKDMEKVCKEYQKTDSQNNQNTENMRDEYNEYIDSVSSNMEEIGELKEAYDKAKAEYDAACVAYEDAKKNYNNSQLTSYDEDTKSSAGNSTEGSKSDSSNSQNSQDTSNSSSTSAADKLNKAQKEMQEKYTAYNSANLAYLRYERLDEKISDKIEDYEDKIDELEKTAKEHLKITSAYKDEMDEYSDLMSEYNRKMSDLNSEITELREEYEDYREDFIEIYGNNDKDDISDRIKVLSHDIDNAEFNIASQTVNEADENFQQQQNLRLAAEEASSAQTVYEQTVASAESAVESKKKEYDKLLEEYEEFCESIGTGGIVYATCSGAVSSVSVSENDSIVANMNIATIMNSRYVYLNTSVSEEDIISLTAGQECSVNLTAYEGKSFSGVIDTISTEPARSSGSISYTVTVKLDDESGLNVLEGMSGEVTFLEGQASGVLYTNVMQ
ncbi:MAG: efflux RND transporter periplasmic adaptor subunit [Oscillospiraceae bacterium]|nr:efflux RND transporter periplasmic adaptor subunit [Oscillospiraceae bacterium]